MKFIRPSLLTTRKSSMTTTGENELTMFKEKIIELGCGNNNMQRVENAKERFESVYCSESYKQSKVAESIYQP